MTRHDHDAGRARLSRRQLLLGGAVAGAGAVAAVGADLALSPVVAASAPVELNGQDVVPFHGRRQAGVDTRVQAHAAYLGLTLHADTDRGALARMMRILADDAARLTQGDPALADSEPELALVPAGLTVTFGFGPELVARAGGAGRRPGWLAPLPAFGIDRLEERWSHGDLLIHIAADDPITVAHASRMLLKDTRSFATLKWTQQGFRRAYGSEAHGVTMRNLFGQVDGTVNPAPGSTDFDTVVWIDESGSWLHDGTSIVIRRVSMNLDTWDRLDRSGREQSVGRTLSNGAPLTGTREHDEPDFAATTALGLPVIADFSHLRRARSDDPSERIFRRSYNYDLAPVDGSISDSGLIFGSYQRDVERQFTPIQRRLDELDLLNEWTTPIGSAVFAIPPGCAAGGFVGETLLA